MSWIKGIKDFLKILIYTITLLFIVNIFSIFIYDIYRDFRSIDRFTHLPDVVKENYSHLSRNDVNSMLEATWSEGWVYEEILGFKERPRVSEFVNVNQFGFRDESDSDNFKSILNDAVWFFGGSTTFGYGVTDNETIPALLGSQMKHRVLNLGRGYYYSEQENLLLLQLLKAGFRPSEAIFLDGINERCSIETYQKQMSMLFSSAQKSMVSYSDYFMRILEPSLSLLIKVAYKLGWDLATSKNKGDDLHITSCRVYNSEITLKQVVSDNLKVRNDICNANNISCLTVLQPFAGIHGEHLVLKDFDLESRERMKIKFDHIKPAFDMYDALDATNALSEHDRHAFVDGVHYSFYANKLIAEAIAKR